MRAAAKLLSISLFGEQAQAEDSDELALGFVRRGLAPSTSSAPRCSAAR
jgi:hypothetical protein